MTGVTAILVAAGSGQRLGAHVAKAFVELGGEPLLAHSVRALAATELLDLLVVVVGPGDVDAGRAIARHNGFADVTAVAGGETRQESVAAGLASGADRGGVVLIHDAARPLVSPRLVRRSVEALTPPWDGVAPALAVVDTLKAVDEDKSRVVRTVDRSRLRAVQTPQVFQRRALQAAHDRFRGQWTATDDLGLVERAGGVVRVIEGDRRNLKITYPEDLTVAEALLRGCR